MAITSRSTRLAVTQETTEGTPVKPTAATDYLSVQEGGLELVPNFESLSNAEIKGTIGSAKDVQGLETPNGSLAHYVKHSGTEATAPEDNLFWKSLFGTEAVRSTERSTTAGSTTSSIVLSTGGSEFQRGDGLLVKDGTNGYSLVTVSTVATNTITPLFNLTAAPASGVATGKNVVYRPADSSHPTLSAWAFDGNGGAIRAMSGIRVTEAAIDAAAGDFVNNTFSFDGLKFYMDPIVIAATNKYIDFNDGGVKVATLTTGTYRDPHDLASEIQTKMDAASSDTITCTYSNSTGKFTIATNGAALSLLFLTGTNNANSVDTTIGFTHTDHTAALTYTSDSALSWASYQTPSYDSSSPVVAKGNCVHFGSASSACCIQDGVQSLSVNIAVEKPATKDMCSETGQQGSVASKRTVTVDLVANLKQHDVEQWRRFRLNESGAFQWEFGVKDSGNYVAGKSCMLSIFDAVVTAINITDTDGIATLELSLKAHVDSSSNGEVYLNFL